MLDRALVVQEPSDDARLVERALETGWRGVLWVGRRGSGRSFALERAAEGLAGRGRTAVRISPHDHADGCPAFVRPSERSDSGGAVTPIFIIDDLDRLPEDQRDELLSRLLADFSDAVILATAGESPWVRGMRAPLRVVRIMPCGPDEALDLLRSQRARPVSPVVASHLAHELDGRAGSIVEVAAALSDDQLEGTRALPDPLPLATAVRTELALWGEHLTEPEKRAALVASVSIINRVDVMLAAAEIDQDALLRGRFTDQIDLHGGRFRVARPSTRQFVHESASVAERTDVHERLAAELRRAGEDRAASWHASLAALAGQPERADEVLDLACGALEAGDSAWAYAAAMEAASQSRPEEGERALLVAGIAALNCGWVRDAADALASVLGSGDRDISTRALAPYVFARTCCQGEVPIAELERLEEVAAEPRCLGGAVAVAASLSAQLGLVGRARKLLDRRSYDECQLGPRFIEWIELRVAEEGAASVETLRAGVALAAELGPVMFGSALPDSAQSAVRRWSPAFMAGATPLVRAYERVARACLDAAEGRQREAAASLIEAAADTPIWIPFCGAGVQLLRRMESDRVEKLSRVGHAAIDVCVFTACSREERAAAESGERWRTPRKVRLTARENEVARIVATGLTNGEAASRLGVSIRTIEVHLSRIYRKLDVRSRSELAFLISAVQQDSESSDTSGLGA